MATGKPVADARVVVDRRGDAQTRPIPYDTVAEAGSSEPGRVEVTKVSAGQCRVWVEAPGYAARVLDDDKYGEQTFKRFTTELARLASVSGRVVDGEGKPLAEVPVRVSATLAMDGRGYEQPESIQTVTDSGGRFELKGLPSGFVLLGARAQGYHFADLFTIHDAPSSDVTLVLNRAGGMRVTVVNSDGKKISEFEGRPVLVEVEPKAGSKRGSWGGSAQVKADGTCEFKGMPPGEYRVTSRPNPANTNRQYAPEQIVTVIPGEPVSVTVVYE